VDFLIETQRVGTDKDNAAETRAKLSAAERKLWEDPEHQAKVGAVRKSKHHIAETKAKISV